MPDIFQALSILITDERDPLLIRTLKPFNHYSYPNPMHDDLSPFGPSAVNIQD